MNEEITKKDLELLKKKYPTNLEWALKKLEENYPIQYLIGDVDFYDCLIKVDERALIPRFETEYFVDKIVKRLKKENKKFNIIDLGCGSGCISIAIKKNCDCNMTAIDISKESLELAKENAKLNKVNINFINEKIEDVNLENYDIIISNPPYVSLREEVDVKTKYEPQNAIFAPLNGLYFYETILNKINKLKRKPFLVAFEIGEKQKDIIIAFIKTYLLDVKISAEQDLTQKDRYIFITFE